ncbi:MAG: GTPase-activating protein [Pycnora praestabilis]|nr:MAG: GTPase-activating protein [Pycnora praestabilis]
MANVQVNIPLRGRNWSENQISTCRQQAPAANVTRPYKVNFATLFRYARRTDVIVLIISTLSAIYGGALIPMMPLIFSRFASSFVKIGGGTNESIKDSLTHNLLWFIYMAINLFIVMFIATLGFTRSGENITRRIREQYLGGLLRQELAFFDDLGVGECTERLTADINAIQKGISEKIARTLHALSTFFTAFVIGFFLLPELTGMLVWSVALGVGLIVTSSYLSRVIKRKSLEATAKAATISEEAISSVRNVKALGAEEKFTEQYMENLSVASQWNARQKTLMGITLGLVIGANYLNISLALWQGTRFLVEGKATFNDVFIIELVMTQALYALTGISNHLETFTQALAAAQRVYKTIDRKSVLDATSNTGEKPRLTIGDIELRDVSFRYPSRKGMVLKSINMQFLGGKTTAIVGASGSGKSSIVDLILRFYDPQQGQVLIDGHDLKDMNLGHLRRKIGVVNQHPSLFAATIRQNIEYGYGPWNPPETFGKQPLEKDSFRQGPESTRLDLVISAAATANAHDFIRKLPNGYDTFIGDRGFMLSGGQKQRITLARALVSNPDILLLDEATSAIDTESEKRIVANLRRQADCRTCVVIAHRLSTIKAADNIIVLSHGSVVEQGTHEDLMEHRGAYFELVKAGSSGGLNVEEPPPPLNDDEIFMIDSVHANETNPDLEALAEEQPSNDVADEEIGLAPAKGQYSLKTLLRFAAQLNKDAVFINIVGLFCCILAGLEESTNAIFFGKSTVSLSLPPDRYRELSHQIAFWAKMYLMLALVQMGVFSGQGWLFAISSERMLRRVKRETFRTILRQDVSLFDKSESSTGHLLQLLSTDTVHLCSLSGATLGLLLITLATLVSAIGIALNWGWKLALICMATIPLILACGYLSVSILSKFQEKTSVALYAAANTAVEAISNRRAVAILTREAVVWKQYHDSLKRLSKSSFATSVKVALLRATCEAIIYLCMALGFWYGGTLLASGEYTSVQFFITFSSIIFGARSAGVIFSFTDDLSKAGQAARRVKTLFDRKPQIDTWSQDGIMTENVIGAIEFQDVYFRYLGNGPYILNKINLTIKAGEHVALVGPSGSGKSSIISLLERFYNPTSGNILVDGIDIATLQIGKYRSFLALVSQDIALYDGNLKDNLMMGINPETVTNTEVVEACKLANLQDFIISLSEGLSTKIGTKGCQLSGGQKQRLSIARALLRSPRILLLDEATSALDSTSEKVVQEALSKASAGRTTITVAHRLKTIRHCDKICFLEGGQIVEEGTHEELMVLAKRYSEFVNLQDMSRPRVRRIKMDADLLTPLVIAGPSRPRMNRAVTSV